MVSRVCLISSLLILSVFNASSQKGPGIFDEHGDVGENVKSGSSVYLPQTGQYIISGAGSNIWGDHDEFQYAWKKMAGDFILHTRAEFVGEKGVEEHRKLGWMVRKSLDGKSPHINAVVHGDGLTSLQFRRTAGGQTEEKKAKMTHANIIQLERKGKTFTMRVAKFGDPFITEQVADLDLGDEVYVGIFVGSHNSDVLETGVFTNVNITVPAWEGLVPYRDYLGSNVETMEVATGRRTVLYSSPKSLQAPNWTGNGKKLIYNKDGLIYSWDISNEQEELIKTGDVIKNNNDHAISFDGTMLGLSSSLAKAGGSVMYTVPIKGGIPKLITPKGPSYLHGWSPDGQYLVFTASRKDDNFDIYRIPSMGGKEVRLTTAPGLDDGAEYTPDGKYIYFNSNRGNSMSIWRMKADGTQQEAVTDDEFHDWFPHISPDGKWIAFISFLKEETKSDDHPFYKHVYLRLMPIEGGKPKVIGYVYGGQSSMNTASWSPDSKKIAFVSNSKN